MGKFAIEGHRTRGCDVINFLEMLGGINSNSLTGNDSFSYYLIEGEEIKGGIYMFGDEPYSFFTLEEIQNKFPLKVGDMITYKWHNTFFTDTIVEMTWDEERNDFICSLKENDFKYYMSDLKKYETGVPKTLVGLFPVTGDRYQMIVDEYYEIINENGKYYVVKKKPQYPKTYEDCCSVLVGREPKVNEISFSKMSLQLVDDNHTNNIAFDAPMIDEINILYRLIMCRNAYWKIAGEEMGLDKPWKPSLKKGETHYAISNVGGKITYEMYGEYNAILMFPTKEMREMFHKNFKNEIEVCKKFL
jgi:hypothetical protein